MTKTYFLLYFPYFITTPRLFTCTIRLQCFKDKSALCDLPFFVCTYGCIMYVVGEEKKKKNH